MEYMILLVLGGFIIAIVVFLVSRGRPDVRQWLSSTEHLECSVEGRTESHSVILVVTSDRAILLEKRFGNRLKDKSDKPWRQLLNVHLKEGFFSSELRLTFFAYHDSVAYHNPHQPDETCIGPPWTISKIQKDEAKNMYRNLKEKEQEWKEKRLTEQLERDRALASFKDSPTQSHR